MGTIFVYPGQVRLSAEADIIRTVLGSCVAVVMHDPIKRVGGMCHYLLAEGGSPTAPSGRYGVFAIDMLLREMLNLGAERDRIITSVYGGGAVVDALSSRQAGIGERNIEFAREKLASLKFRISKSHTGGSSARRIALDVVTGEVDCEVGSPADDIQTSGVVRIQQPKTLTKVLIVDDSATVRTILKAAFERSKKVTVVGTAVDAFEARDRIVKLKPDVITLDIEMPKMSGIQFLEKLMIHHPMPVVVVSSLSSHGAAAARALELGAVEFVHKPSQFDPRVLSDLAETLIPKVIGAGSMKPGEIPKARNVSMAKPSQSSSISAKMNRGAPVTLIGISGNGGASDALSAIVTRLAHDTPPTVVALSTISGFAASWIEKHRSAAKVKLEMLKSGQILHNGTVYICGDNQHVKVSSNGRDLVAQLLDAPPVSGQRPSGDILFTSMAEVTGASSIGILLSGYGKDGVEGLISLRDSGGWTICQDPEDCAFNFSTVAAIEAGAVDETSSRHEIADRVCERRSSAILRAAS
jgi:two-component system chemotaxis response regulator CheB